MKKLKVVLSSVAFVSAVVMAFAFSNANMAVNPHAFDDSNQCVSGTLDQPSSSCLITNPGDACTITFPISGAKPAYEGAGNCGVESQLLQLP